MKTIIPTFQMTRHFPSELDLEGNVYVSADEFGKRLTHIYDGEEYDPKNQNVILCWVAEAFKECKSVEVGFPCGKFHSVWTVFPQATGKDWKQRA